MSIKDKLEKLKGIGIKCLSAEHGKEIVAFYDSIGVDTMKCVGADVNYYYGIVKKNVFICDNVIDVYFLAKELTLDQVKELVKDEPKNFFYDEPKEMLVSHDNKEFRTRIVIAEYNNKFITDSFSLWRYAKEIPKEEPKQPEQDEQFCLIKEFLEWKKNNENK